MNIVVCASLLIVRTIFSIFLINLKIKRGLNDLCFFFQLFSLKKSFGQIDVYCARFSVAKPSLLCKWMVGNIAYNGTYDDANQSCPPSSQLAFHGTQNNIRFVCNQ